MTNAPSDPHPSAVPPVDLDGDAVHRMLELGVNESRRPIDAIIERAGAADGDRWIRQALVRSPVGGMGDPEAALVDGEAGLESLRGVAERCKSVDATPGGDTALDATLGYFLTIAAALAHHGVKLTRRARPQIDETLLDLAAATPDPWRTLLCRAIDAPMTDAE